MNGFSCVESNGPASEVVDAAKVEETNVTGGISSYGGRAVEGCSRSVEDLKLSPIHLFWETWEEGFAYNQVCLLA